MLMAMAINRKKKGVIVMRKISIGRIQAVLVLLALVFANTAFLPQVFATVLTKSFVTLTNMATSGTSGVVFAYTVSASNTGTTLTIQFPQYTGGAAGSVTSGAIGYSTSLGGVNCTNAQLTGAGHNLPTGGSITASGSSTTITFRGMSAMTSSFSYCGVLTGTAVTNPTAATTNDTAIITAGTDAAETVALDIISSDTVSVTAIVPPTYTLSLAGSPDAFTTNLSSGAVATTTGVTATVNTNAINGWYLYGEDANTGLTSASAGHTIASTSVGANHTLSFGAEGYETGVTSVANGSGGGTVTANTQYSSSGLGNGAGLNNTNENALASGNAPSVNATVTFKEFAGISGTTPYGGDYADTITIVGAGSF